MEAGQKIPPGQRVEQILQQLQSYQAAEIEMLRLSRDLSKEIAEKILKEGMMNGIETSQYDALLKRFLNPEELKSHGRPIFYSDIKKIDTQEHIKVECLSEDMPIFDTIHEYHQRVISYMDANGYCKVCETHIQPFTVPIM